MRWRTSPDHGKRELTLPTADARDRQQRVTKRPLSPRANWWPCNYGEPAMEHVHCTTTIREPWNKGKLVGQRAPFNYREGSF